MTNNYLKTQKRFFFFDSHDQVSRIAAWEAAGILESKPERISVWQGSEQGRYPGEKPGGSHPIVGAAYSPISGRVRVIGYSFDVDAAPKASA